MSGSVPADGVSSAMFMLHLTSFKPQPATLPNLVLGPLTASLELPASGGLHLVAQAQAEGFSAGSFLHIGSLSATLDVALDGGDTTGFQPSLWALAGSVIIGDEAFGFGATLEGVFDFASASGRGVGLCSSACTISHPGGWSPLAATGLDDSFISAFATPAFAGSLTMSNEGWTEVSAAVIFLAPVVFDGPNFRATFSGTAARQGPSVDIYIKTGVSNGTDAAETRMNLDSQLTIGGGAGGQLPASFGVSGSLTLAPTNSAVELQLSSSGFLPLPNVLPDLALELSGVLTLSETALVIGASASLVASSEISISDGAVSLSELGGELSLSLDLGSTDGTRRRMRELDAPPRSMLSLSGAGRIGGPTGFDIAVSASVPFEVSDPDSFGNIFHLETSHAGGWSPLDSSLSIAPLFTTPAFNTSLTVGPGSFIEGRGMAQWAPIRLVRAHLHPASNQASMSHLRPPSGPELAMTRTCA